MDFAARDRRAATDGLDSHLVPPPLGRPRPEDCLAIAATFLAQVHTMG